MLFQTTQRATFLDYVTQCISYGLMRTVRNPPGSAKLLNLAISLLFQVEGHVARAASIASLRESTIPRIVRRPLSRHISFRFIIQFGIPPLRYCWRG